MLNKNFTLLFFSDDIEWCQKEFDNLDRNKFFVNIESDYIEFYLMTLCKHHIIANSTFSWWAAYLNKNPNKAVIIPEPWFGYAPIMSTCSDTEGLYLPNWIIVKDEVNIAKNLNYNISNENMEHYYDNITETQIDSIVDIIEQTNKEIEEFNTNIESDDKEIEESNTNIESDDTEIEESNTNIESNDEEIEESNTNIESNDEEIEIDNNKKALLVIQATKKVKKSLGISFENTSEFRDMDQLSYIKYLLIKNKQVLVVINI